MESQVVKYVVDADSVARRTSTRVMRVLRRATGRVHRIAAVGAGLFLATAAVSALAQSKPAGSITTPVFSTPYVPEGQPAAEQARIVYYRVKPTSEPIFSVGGNSGDSANVYVDGAFQTALLPGGFSTFCVAAGEHRLGAFMGDAPRYEGKAAGSSMRLEGGTTYFFRVRSDNQSAAVPIARGEAETDLQQNRRQIHVISRAASVVPCREQAAQVAPVLQTGVVGQVRGADSTVQAEVLFSFARSELPKLQEGHPLLRLIEQFQRENAAGSSIELVGYADPIGTDAAALALGLARAEAVRALLMRYGIPAASIRVLSSGNKAPVVKPCKGPTPESRIACNAPNRRVLAHVVGR